MPTRPILPDRVRAVAGLDGAWSYDVSAYDNLLLKAALVLLMPLGVTAALLNASTDPVSRAAHGSINGSQASLSAEA